MLDEKIIQRLADFWALVKDYAFCLKITGSYLNPYIKVRHDIDIICVFETVEQRAAYIKYCLNNKEVMKIKNELKEEANLTILMNLKNSFWTDINSWKYGSENQILFGQETNYNKPILENKEAYLQMANDSIEWRIIHYEETGHVIKTLYHILTGLYIIKNNSYELTEEQIQRINDIHDQVSQELLVSALYEAKDLLEELKK